MKYYINYNTGAGNKEFNGNLEQAQETAEAGMTYTQCDVIITDVTGQISVHSYVKRTHDSCVLFFFSIRHECIQ